MSEMVSIDELISRARALNKLIPRINWDELELDSVRTSIASIPGGKELGLKFLDDQKRPVKMYRTTAFIVSEVHKPKDLFGLYCKALGWLYTRWNDKDTSRPISIGEAQELGESYPIVSGYYEGLSEDDIDPRPTFNLMIELLLAWRLIQVEKEAQH
jgi:hypothetical protein